MMHLHQTTNVYECQQAKFVGKPGSISSHEATAAVPRGRTSATEAIGEAKVTRWNLRKTGRYHGP